MRSNGVGYSSVTGNITAWFRAITHQARCVSQKKSYSPNDRLLQSLCHGTPLCMYFSSFERLYAKGNHRSSEKAQMIHSPVDTSSMHKTDSCSPLYAADRSW